MADVKKNDFNSTVNSLFDGMSAFLTAKTVMGEPQRIGDTTIIPLVDVNFGVGTRIEKRNHDIFGRGSVVFLENPA